MAHIGTLRDVNPFRYKCPVGLRNHYIEYKNLLIGNLDIVHKDGKPFNYQVKAFILNELIEGAQVGYDKREDLWSTVSGTHNINEYGNPVRVTFFLKNGRHYTRVASYDDKPDGAYLIKALPDTYSIGALIGEEVAFLDHCDIAIKQNMDALKTPYIVVCDDPKIRKSIETALKDKKDGRPVLVVSKKLGDALKSVDINVDYVADKYEEMKTKRRDQLLNKIGIMSANINKKERVQVGEVNATVGQCKDYIYDLIDNFNSQCETYGIDAMMIDNTSLDEYENAPEGNEEGAEEGNTDEIKK